MAFLSKGYTFVDGASTADAANLNALVDDATVLPDAISDLSLKDPVTGAEEVMINDAGTLKKATVQGIIDFGSLVPVGAMMEYAGTTEPDGWFFCYGQAVDRTTYSELFSKLGTVHGSGNGSTTFNLPDRRGRVSVGRDDMGGTSANRMTVAFNGDTLGAVGGTETVTLTTAQLSAHGHNHTHNLAMYHTALENGAYGCGTNAFQGRVFVTAVNQGGYVYADNTQAGGGQAHSNTQPGIVLNVIIKY